MPALIKKPNSLHKRSVDDNALIIKAKEAEIAVQYPASGTNVTIKVKDKQVKVSDKGIDMTGDVKIKGDVKISGNLDISETVTADDYITV